MFDHRDDSEAGTRAGQGASTQERTWPTRSTARSWKRPAFIEAEPTPLGVHEHLDGLGQPTRSHFFRMDAPEGLPHRWEHVVGGEGIDAGMTFSCRFESTPEL